MSELVEAVYRLVSVMEAAVLIIAFILFLILIFKGSSTNDELRRIRQELERLNSVEKGNKNG